MGAVPAAPRCAPLSDLSPRGVTDYLSRARHALSAPQKTAGTCITDGADSGGRCDTWRSGSVLRPPPVTDCAACPTHFWRGGGSRTLRRHRRIMSTASSSPRRRHVASVESVPVMNTKQVRCGCKTHGFVRICYSYGCL